MRFNPSTSDLAGVPHATLQRWLGEAQEALHQLSIGGLPQALSYGQGESTKSVTYTRAEMASLRAHIASLKAQLGIHDRSRRAIRPIF
jgi:hypothetical protein